MLPKDYQNLYKFLKFYQKIKKAIAKELTKYNSGLLESEEHTIIKELLANFTDLNSDGKCLRGTIIALAYLNANNSYHNDYYLPLAVAYETFQTSILIHDDIIDNDNYRRGKKTIPYRYHEKNNNSNSNSNFKITLKDIANSLGICIGDLGFYLSNSIISKNYYTNPQFPELLNYYNEIVINTIKGEILDVELPFQAKYQNYQTKEKDILEIYKLKTAYYTITGPFKLGLILSGKKLSSNLELALNNLGIAFQIKDDILGIYGKTTKTGKSNSSDISEYKQTILYTNTINNPLYKDKLLNYYGKKVITGKDQEEVKKIFKSSGSYDYALSKMQELFTKSRKIIIKDNNITSNTKDILLGFITYLELRER
jgi:geranylgeranyl pyrophosphate synthase